MPNLPKNIYALLIGINEYSPKSQPKVPPPLRGCLNDVKLVKEKLESLVRTRPDYALHIQTLFNEEATREALIRHFREFLVGPTQSGDIVYFHFSGHGSYETAPKKFKLFFAEKKLETQVYYDSREPGKNDLADKELAVLLSEIPEGVETFVMLDCCFSDSGDRKPNLERFHDGRKKERALKNFLGAYDKQESLQIPGSSHILFAACTRKQRARECTGGDGRKYGAFTHAFAQVLTHASFDLSYFDLIQKTKLQMPPINDAWPRKYHQNPRWDQLGKAHIHNAFLFGDFRARNERIRVSRERGNWYAAQGAIDGINVHRELPSSLSLFESDTSPTAIGKAHLSQVGFQKSEITPHFNLDEGKEYFTEFAPYRIPLYLEEGLAPLQQFLFEQASTYVISSSSASNCKYGIKENEGALEFWDLAQSHLILGIQSWTEACFPYLRSLCKKIHTWERVQQLGNPYESIDSTRIKFGFRIEDGSKKVLYSQDQPIRLPFQAPHIEYSLWGENHTGIPLYFMVLYTGPKLETEVHYRDEDRKGPSPSRLNLERRILDLDPRFPAEKNSFRLLYSTEYIEDSLAFDEWECEEFRFYGERVSEEQLLNSESTRGFELPPKPQSKNPLTKTVNEWGVLDLEVIVERKEVI